MAVGCSTGRLEGGCNHSPKTRPILKEEAWQAAATASHFAQLSSCHLSPASYLCPLSFRCAHCGGVRRIPWPPDAPAVLGKLPWSSALHTGFPSALPTSTHPLPPCCPLPPGVPGLFCAPCLLPLAVLEPRAHRPPSLRTCYFLSGWMCLQGWFCPHFHTCVLFSLCH